MPLNLPEWLDKPFLISALQGEEEKGPQVTVEDFTAVLAVAAGNNYTSQLFRVNVIYKYQNEEESKEQTKTLIVKAPHTQFQEGVGIDEFFVKEPVMYSRILPRMKELIKQDFAPTTYYSTQKGVLVFQDLKEAGYTMCDKFKQLDYAHCEIVVKTLAKFHAVSVALHSKNPEEIEKLGAEPIFKEGNPVVEIMKPMMKFALEIVTDTLKEADESELALQFLLNRQENLYDSILTIFKPKREGLNVLNHGDLWNNNMMFKHTDSGEVEDVKFIDYQVLRYMSPAIDILYFTWTSANEEVRENRLQELYDIYLQALNDSLEQLCCKERYTSEELWQDMKSSIDFALFISTQTLPLVLAEEADAFDMSEFDMTEFKNKIINGSIDPNMLRLYNGKQFKAKAPTIIKQIYKNFQ